MGFCKITGKALLISINTIFLLLGWIITGFGIWILTTNSYLDSVLLLLAHVITPIPKAFIILGIVTSFIAFLGFWGASTDKKWMLRTYASILLIILFIQICIGVFVGIIVSSYDNSQQVNAFRQRAEGIVNNETKTIDTVQQIYECCGYYNPETMRFQNGTYPPSCCGFTEFECIQPYPVGCSERFTDIMVKGGAIYIAFAGFQILCIAVAFLLASAIQKKLSPPSPYNRMT